MVLAEDVPQFAEKLIVSFYSGVLFFFSPLIHAVSSVSVLNLSDTVRVKFKDFFPNFQVLI